MAHDPVNSTLMRVDVALFGATVLLFSLVFWLKGLRGEPPTTHSTGQSRVPAVVMLGFGIVCLVAALLPPAAHPSQRELARENLAPCLTPICIFFFLGYVVWAVREARWTVAWLSGGRYRQAHRAGRNAPARMPARSIERPDSQPERLPLPRASQARFRALPLGRRLRRRARAQGRPPTTVR